jgi:hypothetical protein
VPDPIIPDPAVAAVPRATGAGLAAKLGAKIATRDGLLKTLRAELATATTALAAATTSQKPTPEAITAELTALKAELLTGKHKAEFAKLAKAAGVPEGAIDDLFTLSGHKVEGEPDSAKIKTTLDATLEARKDWLTVKPGDGTPPPAPAPLGKGLGSGKGPADSQVAAPVVATREQLSDPEWCWANAEAQRAAAKLVV